MKNQQFIRFLKFFLDENNRCLDLEGNKVTHSFWKKNWQKGTKNNLKEPKKCKVQVKTLKLYLLNIQWQG